MKRIYVINICLYLLLIKCELIAQEGFTTDLDRLIVDWATENEWDTAMMENVYEELSNFLLEPLNLNGATKEQLEKLFFLSDKQVENILAYIYITGEMHTLYELQLVDGMDLAILHYLLPFVTVRPVKKRENRPTVKELLKYGRREIVSRFDLPFYRRQGIVNRHQPDRQENRYYLGPGWYSDLRYSYRYKDKIHAGFTAQKDAGEPFFSSGNKKGYDFYSFYFLGKDLRRVKTLALGNYRLNFGQGLVMNTGFSMGKNASIASIGNSTQGIRQHASTEEFDFFQGGAITLGSEEFTVSAFYSMRNWDGIVGDSSITSIKKDGLHRINRDFERKNVIRHQCMGGNVHWSHNCFSIGMTGIHYFFDQTYQPAVQPYSRYALRGRSFYNIGMDYKYTHPFFTLTGEAAMCHNNSIAVINTVKVPLFSDCRLVLLHRYYPVKYINLYSRSISEGTAVQNEAGYYLGLEIVPVRNFKLFLYGDYFRFPWLKYGIDAPSSGYDLLLNALYKKSGFSFNLKYRYKQKEQNFTDNEKGRSVLPNYQHQFSLVSGYQWSSFSYKVFFDYKNFHIRGASADKGTVITHQLSYDQPGFPLRADTQYSWFNTDNYNCRIYRFE